MEETRQILKRRKRYEYKLRRRTKCKEDFLQYIQYEINALGLVRLRRQKTGYTFKRLEIDIAIVQRIHQLFRLALIRFKEDVKLWLSHIEFSKQRREKATVSRLFTDMLQVHNKKPGLWLSAAKWEFEENANPENARSLLQRGLRFNPESKQLWLEYYRMELLYAEKMRKRREILGVADEEPGDDVTDAVLNGTVAGVVYKQALQALPGDVPFVLSFVAVTQLFDFTRTLEDDIFEHLQTHFPHSELTWSAVARRCLGSSSQNSSTDKPKKDKYKGEEEGEDRCYQVLEEAVSRLPTEAMWTEYVTVCLERLEQKAPKAVRRKRTEKVLEIFKRAAAAELLSSRLYICWLDRLVSNGDVSQTEDVSRQATERYPTDVALWRYRLVLLTTALTEEKRVIQTLQQARKTVPDRDIWPLWEVTLQYLVSINSESTEKYFQICTSSPVRELCLPSKTLYLKWAAITKGIQHARHIYNSLTKVKPVPVELYRACIDIETSQAALKIKRIRRVYEDAVQDFGSEDTDLWLDYIKQELRHPKEGSERAGHLHFRAMKTLTGEHVERFVTKYTLLQTGHSV